jgi:hypothetical protein
MACQPAEPLPRPSSVAPTTTPTSPAPTTTPTSPAPSAAPPRTSSDAGRSSCSDFSYTFPADEFGLAASTCATAADCVAVHFAGGCWSVTSATLTSPLATTYRAWADLGCNRPSGSPAALAAVEAARVSEICGVDWAGVGCEAGRCTLTPSDCEYGGMRRAACTAQGGRWGGCIQGRGRSPGCSLPTKDAGKPCTDRSQCESACVRGACYGYTHFKGCGVMRDGKESCVE